MDFSTLDLHELTAERNARIQLLNNTDYKALKAFEGYPSEDWVTMQPQREQWREEINAIDDCIADLEAAGEADGGDD